MIDRGLIVWQKKEKLNTIKEEKATNKMFVELTDDELTQVLGGVMMQYDENANETTNFRPP